MTDIVERLRKVVGDLPPQNHVPLAKEAADEIERLRAALESIAKNTCCDKCQEAALVAKSVLNEQLATEPLLKQATAATSFDASTPEGAKKARENADNYRKNLKPFA